MFGNGLRVAEMARVLGATARGAQPSLNDDDDAEALESHTLMIVRDFLRRRGYTAALGALDAATPPDETLTREQVIRDLALEQVTKRRSAALPNTLLEIVVDTLLRRTKVLRKYSSGSTADEAPPPAATTSPPPPSSVRLWNNLGGGTVDGGVNGGAREGGAAVESMASLVDSMHSLLLGKAAAQFTDAWRQQGFGFTSEDSVPFGLEQVKGGTCGVMACVQAYFLRALLFERASTDVVDVTDSEPALPAGIEARQVDKLLRFSKSTREACLLTALGDVLWGVSRGGPVTLITSTAQPLPARRRELPDALRRATFQTRQELDGALRLALGAFSAKDGSGVLLLLYSSIATAGVPAIRAMMDRPDTNLIGSHGYCTQELVNLFLLGDACSNVFDGERTLGTGEDAMKLRGVPANGGSSGGACPVGLLCHAEAHGHTEVGSAFKRPTCPVWLTYMESHYTVVFSPLPRGPPEDGSTFDLYYYDQLGHQDELIRLTVNPQKPPAPPGRAAYDLVPPLDETLRTRWPKASVDWNGTDPLL